MRKSDPRGWSERQFERYFDGLKDEMLAKGVDPNMSASGKPFPSNIVKICSFSVIVLGILAILFLFLMDCSGQTISQPVPQLSGNPGQLQQPQVYWVPTRAWTPVRNLLNAPPLFYWAPYTPVGAPYDAQVQPVVPYRRAW